RKAQQTGDRHDDADRFMFGVRVTRHMAKDVLTEVAHRHDGKQTSGKCGDQAPKGSFQIGRMRHFWTDQDRKRADEIRCGTHKHRTSLMKVRSFCSSARLRFWIRRYWSSTSMLCLSSSISGSIWGLKTAATCLRNVLIFACISVSPWFSQFE